MAVVGKFGALPLVVSAPAPIRVAFEMRHMHEPGYGSVMTSNDEAAALVADAQQAQYFRQELLAQRQMLLDSVGKRRALIERRTLSGSRLTGVHNAEADIRHLERMIDRLAHRFPASDV